MIHLFLLSWFFVLGICTGGFFAVCLYRIPRRRSLFGDSLCPQCQHKIRLFDMLPLLGWISLGGKCRSCKQPIGLYDSFIELTSGLLFMFLGLFFLVKAEEPGAIYKAGWQVLYTGYAVLFLWGAVVFHFHNVKVPIGYWIAGIILALSFILPVNILPFLPCEQWLSKLTFNNIVIAIIVGTTMNTIFAVIFFSLLMPGYSVPCYQEGTDAKNS